jgi:hypothetical protein
MKFIMLTVVGLIVMAEGARAEEAFVDWSHKACAQIHKTYSSCGQRFDYTNGSFHFSTSLGKKSVLCTDGERRAFYDRLDQMDIASILMIPPALNFSVQL